MSEPAGKAVFLSYASQDAEAARHIADALRASGVEVWFDQSELRGGDAWDANIRKQIKDCTLFIPIISANTQARAEGYFRREWRLAVERMHDLADDQPFLLPVVIDDTSSVDARVPERFRERQWTRLPGGEANPAFVDRVRALVRSETREHSGSASGRPETLTRSAPRKARVWWLAGIAVALTIAATVYLFRAHPPGPAPIATTSEAQQLVARARAMYERGGESHTREDFATAEQLVAQARTLEPNNDEVWATAARIDTWFVFYRFDTSESRKQQARTNAARALKLAPHGFEARRAQAGVLLHVVALPAVRPEAERLLRTLSEERPHDLGVLNSLGLLLREDGRFDEAATFFLRAKDPGSAAWTYYHAGRFEEASAAVDEVLVTNRTVANLLLKSMIEHVGREDLDAAQATLDQLPAAALLEDDAASAAVILRIYRREPEKALEILRAIPRDFLASNWFTGPKAYLTGWAHDLAGRKEAAQADWRVALSVVGQRLAATPNDPDLLNWKAYLLSVVGERDEAERILRLYQQLSGVSDTEITFDSAWIYLGLGRLDEVIAWLSSVLQGPKRDPFMHAYARFDPDFDPLRSDPRFEALLRDTLPKGAKPFPEQKTEDGDPKTVPP